MLAVHNLTCAKPPQPLRIISGEREEACDCFKPGRADAGRTAVLALGHGWGELDSFLAVCVGGSAKDAVREVPARCTC